MDKAEILKECVRGIMSVNIDKIDALSMANYFLTNLPTGFAYVWKVTYRSDLNPLGRYDTEEVFYFWLEEDLEEKYSETDDSTDIEEVDVLDADLDELISIIEPLPQIQQVIP